MAVAELEAGVALLNGGDRHRAEPRRHHAQDEAEESPQLGSRHDETGLEGEFYFFLCSLLFSGWLCEYYFLLC